MKLYYNKSKKEEQEIYERMKDMSLAFESQSLDQGLVLLVDGSQKFEGITAANKHLDEIAGELHSWYYCNC